MGARNVRACHRHVDKSPFCPSGVDTSLWRLEDDEYFFEKGLRGL